MLDEKKIVEIQYKENKVNLSANFKAFKKLNKISGNAFLVIDEFANDVEKRLEHLPILIQSMADVELTLDEIENEILGMEYIKVMQMANVIFSILNAELTTSEVKVTEKNEVSNSEKN
jgi:hypothetical protein